MVETVYEQCRIAHCRAVVVAVARDEHHLARTEPIVAKERTCNLYRSALAEDKLMNLGIGVVYGFTGFKVQQLEVAALGTLAAKRWIIIRMTVDSDYIVLK